MKKIYAVIIDIAISIGSSFIYERVTATSNYIDMDLIFRVSFFLTILLIPITLLVMLLIEKRRNIRNKNAIIHLYMQHSDIGTMEIDIVKKIVNGEIKLENVEPMFSKEKYIHIVKLVGVFEIIEVTKQVISSIEWGQLINNFISEVSKSNNDESNRTF